jgi:hypothetical protein
MKASEITYDECRNFLLQQPSESKKFVRALSLDVFVNWKMETIKCLGDVDVFIEQPTKHNSFQVVFIENTGMKDDHLNEIYLGDELGKPSLPNMKWLVKHGKHEFVCESWRYTPGIGWTKTPNNGHTPPLQTILMEGHIKLNP